MDPDTTSNPISVPIPVPETTPVPQNNNSARSLAQATASRSASYTYSEGSYSITTDSDSTSRVSLDAPRQNISFPFKAMVFEGAGSTAVSYIGALEKCPANILPQIQYFAGSSSGSMPAAALACNASLAQVSQMIKEADFNKFLDESQAMCQDVFRLWTKFGYYKGEYFEQWFGQALAKLAGGQANITFKEAFEATGKFLVITCVDLTTGQLIYMNHLDTPNLAIKKAVRRSISLPLIFKPDTAIETIEVIDQVGQSAPQTIQRCYIDGGMLDNYPIDYFDNILSPEQTIGFKVMTSMELNEITNPYINAYYPKAPANLLDFVMRSLIIIMNKNFKLHQSTVDWNRTIKIDTVNHSAINFNLSGADKEFLIEQGRKGAQKFFDNYTEKMSRS